MIAYYPVPKFIPISISPCMLMCKHCMGKYLEGMKKIYEPEKLLQFGIHHAGRGGTGMLVSGGYTRDGRLLNLEKMLPAMKKLRKKMCIAVHPGFIDMEEAEKMTEAVDIAFVDIASDGGIKNVYGLNATTMDYIKNMEYLIDAGIKVSPHITLGLNFGKIEEWELLDEIKKHRIVKLVIDVILPTKGTPFENVETNLEEIRDFLMEARKKFDRIAMGCMRPRNGIDEIAYEIGIDEIAVPSPKLVKKVANVEKRYVCCGCP